MGQDTSSSVRAAVTAQPMEETGVEDRRRVFPSKVADTDDVIDFFSLEYFFDAWDTV